MSPLDKILNEIEDLKEAKMLLEKVWHWYGPYGPPTDLKTPMRISLAMPQELHKKLLKYFKFDDSE